jgi:hypothetical protein
MSVKQVIVIYCNDLFLIPKNGLDLHQVVLNDSDYSTCVSASVVFLKN